MQTNLSFSRRFRQNGPFKILAGTKKTRFSKNTEIVTTPRKETVSSLGVFRRPLTLILLQKYRDINGRRIVIQIQGRDFRDSTYKAETRLSRVRPRSRAPYGRGSSRKGVVQFFNWKPREPRKARDEIVNSTPTVIFALGQNFYQTYARTRVERGFFSCFFAPKHRKISRKKRPEMAPFLSERKPGCAQLWWYSLLTLTSHWRSRPSPYFISTRLHAYFGRVLDPVALFFFAPSRCCRSSGTLAIRHVTRDTDRESAPSMKTTPF